jgi:hypothetical protein
VKVVRATGLAEIGCGAHCVGAVVRGRSAFPLGNLAGKGRDARVRAPGAR